MFNTGNWPTVMESVIESAESGLESAYSSTDSNADSAKFGMWVWAFNLDKDFRADISKNDSKIILDGSDL